MTFQSILPARPFDGLMTTISRYKAEQADHRARRTKYNRTVNELSAMSDIDLCDIGLNRGDIRDVAQKAAAMT